VTWHGRQFDPLVAPTGKQFDFKPTTPSQWTAAIFGITMLKSTLQH
jgi:hypothetical protein